MQAGQGLGESRDERESMAESKTSRGGDIATVLDGLRKRIDGVDREILDGLNDRARLVEEVGRLKQGGGASVYAPARERRIVESLQAANTGPFPEAGIRPVFREIISATRSLEESLHVAYMGPAGTFSHEAALKRFGNLADFTEVGTIREVFSAVEVGKSQLGVVPVENTTEGIVTQTFDALVEFSVPVCAEVVLTISLDLLSQSGRLADVRRVASHPQPLAQARRWLEHHLPGAERVQTASTVIAAEMAARTPEVAALASTTAGGVHGLQAVERQIQDRSDNATRFLVIGAGETEPGTQDLTSVVFTIGRDQSGGLHGLIAPMARRGLNLTSIHLRPMPGRSWEYLFFIDLEGHRSDPEVAAALEEAASAAQSSRILGSFPRAESLWARGEG